MKGESPTIPTTDENGQNKNITAEKNITILGCKLQNNTTWKDHLEEDKESLIPRLRQQIGLLKHVGKEMSYKGKLLLANGLIQSRLQYLLPIWGGTPYKYKKNYK